MNNKLKSHFLTVFFIFSLFSLIIVLTNDSILKKIFEFVAIESIVVIIAAGETYLQRKYILQ